MLKVFTSENECALHNEVYEIMDQYGIKENEVLFSCDIDSQHPKNQIKSIEDIVKDNKIKMIVTYSPYVFQKLFLLSTDPSNSNKIEFYYMVDNSLKNISNNIQIAFKSFSDPMQDIAW